MLITDLYGRQIADTSRKPAAPVKAKREKLPPKPTRRDRELEHDGNTYQGFGHGGRSNESVPITSDEEWMRHHNWRDKRSRVKQVLGKSGTGARGMDAFCNCGAECVVEWSESEKRYRLRGSYCHGRHCEPCQKSKSSLIINNLRAKLGAEPDRQYRFITLTLRHNRTTKLADQVKRLYACYKKLRQHKSWQRSQRGGAAMLEIKLVERGGWHPHLHIVSEGVWMDKRELMNAWSEITGDSFVADIRQLSNKKDVAFYVGKYVTKGVNDAVWDDEEKAIEYVCAMRGVRSCATFGTWRGYKLLGKPKAVHDFKPVALLSSIAGKARAGCVASVHLLEILRESFQYSPGRRRPPKPPD